MSTTSADTVWVDGPSFQVAKERFRRAIEAGTNVVCPGCRCLARLRSYTRSSDVRFPRETLDLTFVHGLYDGRKTCSVQYARTE